MGPPLRGDSIPQLPGLRRAARSGIHINDGFARDEAPLERVGYEHYVPYDESRRLLESRGDIILEERLMPDAEVAAFNWTTTKMIRQRVCELVKRHPGSAGLLHSYVRIEEEECEVLESKTTQAVWLLQRK